jgi:hypothetical protein
MRSFGLNDWVKRRRDSQAGGQQCAKRACQSVVACISEHGLLPWFHADGRSTRRFPMADDGWNKRWKKRWNRPL